MAYHLEETSRLNRSRELFQALLNYAKSLLKDKNSLTTEREEKIEEALQALDVLDTLIAKTKTQKNNIYLNEYREANIDFKEMKGNLEAQRGKLDAPIGFYEEALVEAKSSMKQTGNKDSAHRKRIIRLEQNIKRLKEKR